MAAVLSVVRWPDGTEQPVARRLTSGTLRIGRHAEDADWVLPDASKGLSRLHCRLQFGADGLRVIENDRSSTNGTYVNEESERLAAGESRRLVDGDRLRLGPYEVQIRFEPAPADAGAEWGAEWSSPQEREAWSEPDLSATPPEPETDLETWFYGPGSGPLLHSHPATREAATPAPSPTEFAPAESAPAGSAPAAEADALIAAFMAGAGLADERPRDPLAAMRQAGAAFRAMVAGLRALLAARDSVRTTLGLDQTSFQRQGNNPLKWAANDDDALTALLGIGRRTGMTPAETVEDALLALRRHEQANLPAMQAAMLALLAGLDPGGLWHRAAAASGLPFEMPLQRRARAWDLFKAEHARILGTLDDDFEAAVGRRFAREYARRIQELRAAEEVRR